MNEEMEMSLETGEEAPAAETPETAPEGGENSAQETRSSDAGQDPAEDTNDGEEGENTPEDDAVEADEYDGFYHDLSDFENQSDRDEQSDQDEQEDDAEGGDTPTDPEGEDGDEGENEGEAESEDDGDDADGSEQEEHSETDEDASEQEEPPETESEAEAGAAGFASWEQEDRAAILAAHPELESVFAGKHLRDVLDDPALFGFMRGSAENRAKYSAVEAFEKASAKLLATRAAKAQAKQNSKQHIKSGGGKAATPPSSIPQSMMKQLREMFPGKTRAELEQLYKNVT